MVDFPEFGINRRELDRILVSVGGFIEDVAKTGEIRYRHPLLSARPRADKRRKDAPMHMVKFVRHVISLLQSSGNTPKHAA